VRATELPPLAKQIVYQSLVGLSASDAASAVLRSVGYDHKLSQIPDGWPSSVATQQMGAAAGGVFDVQIGRDLRLERKPAEVSPQKRSRFSNEDLYSDMAAGVEQFCSRLRVTTGNFQYSDRLRQHADVLKKSVTEKYKDSDPLAINRSLIWVLRIIALDKAEGLLPPYDEVSYFEGDLRGYYNRIEGIFPRLRQYRKMDARDRFAPPSDDEQRAISIVHRSFGDPRIANEALSPGLSLELKQAGENIEQVKDLSQTAQGALASDLAIETQADAATRSLAVWGWLAGAREKFMKSGKDIEDVSKAIESYEKLYTKLSPEMREVVPVSGTVWRQGQDGFRV
jgi:hypothetical protein